MFDASTVFLLLSVSSLCTKARITALNGLALLGKVGKGWVSSGVEKSSDSQRSTAGLNLDEVLVFAEVPDRLGERVATEGVSQNLKTSRIPKF